LLPILYLGPFLYGESKEYVPGPGVLTFPNNRPLSEFPNFTAFDFSWLTFW
jgi:hypothetical protein